MEQNRLRKLAGILTEGKDLSTPKKGRIPNVSAEIPKYIFFLDAGRVGSDLMKAFGYTSFNKSSFRKAAKAAGVDEDLLGYAFDAHEMTVYHQKGDMSEAVELMKKNVSSEDALFDFAFSIV